MGPALLLVQGAKLRLELRCCAILIYTVVEWGVGGMVVQVRGQHGPAAFGGVRRCGSQGVGVPHTNRTRWGSGGRRSVLTVVVVVVVVMVVVVFVMVAVVVPVVVVVVVVGVVVVVVVVVPVVVIVVLVVAVVAVQWWLLHRLPL